MEQSIENKTKPELKNRLTNFYKSNKVKIYSTLTIIIITFISFTYLKYNNAKKNILDAEKFVEAGIFLASNKNDEAKDIYEKIILSKNKFYSILSLNAIIEKNLISDKNKILKYFDILENSIKLKDQEDLILLKKALYLLKENEIKAGNNLLKGLIDKNSNLKIIAEEILRK